MLGVYPRILMPGLGGTKQPSPGPVRLPSRKSKRCLQSPRALFEWSEESQQQCSAATDRRSEKSRLGGALPARGHPSAGQDRSTTAHQVHQATCIGFTRLTCEACEKERRICLLKVVRFNVYGSYPPHHPTGSLGTRRSLSRCLHEPAAGGAGDGRGGETDLPQAHQWGDHSRGISCCD